MKKLLRTIVIMLCFATYLTFNANAQIQTLSSKQCELRNEIQAFIKAEGFQPTIDNDGDIKFKRQGNFYYVIISKTDENPMYLTFSKYFNYNDQINKSKLMLFNLENDYKMCKIKTFDNNYAFRSEMYITEANAFTTIFYKILNVFDSVEQKLKEL
ncbi:MAG: hypothetical protein J6V35_02125 [Bacteroidales bacterium]|nr:hypothetical protein [Bacteroidales bacterium]